MKSKSTRRKGNSQSRSNEIYETLTKRFVEAVQNEKNPFKMAFEKLGGFAANAKTGRTYNGMNQMLLGFSECDYETPFYLTYKQAQEAGGNVRKGEKGHKITFWKILEANEPDENGKKRKIPMLKVYTVFNVAQCDGLEGLDIPKMERFDNPENSTAESIIADMPTPPRISTQDGYARACYQPATDIVKMPDRSQFVDSESYYHVLFHELAHSTGHKRRLSREGITRERVTLAGFGTESYSREELIAEMAASFCSARLNIFSEETEKMTVAYLRSWLRPLQDDVKAIAHASGKAMKACQYIFGEIEAEKEDTKKPKEEPAPMRKISELPDGEQPRPGELLLIG